jgi:aminoglycoside phosphotransferase (APT) family kinase protein
MITTGHLGAAIRQHWHAFTDGERPPERLSFLLLTKGDQSLGKMVLLTFVAGEARPRFVVKLGRLKEHNDAIQTEYRNLQRIEAYGRHGRVRTPRPLLCWEDAGRLCLLESALDGPDLWRATARARSVAFLDPIVDWLIHLARSTQGPRPRHPAVMCTELIDRVAGHVRSGQDHAQLETISRQLARHPADPLPQVFQHDDMGTWNVTVAPDGTIGILDWEASRHDGVPAVDLFYFLAFYGSMMDTVLAPADRLRSFVETFFGHGPFARLARSAVHRYAQALALSRGWLAPLFGICWLQQTIVDVERDGFALSDSLSWQMLATMLERDGRFNFLEAA